MKRKQILFLLLTFLTTFCFSETKEKRTRKGDISFLWGWNRGWYSNSDIHFTGSDYDFTLENVVAKDRPTKFDLYKYLHPEQITIPQTNFRAGYFMTDHYEISLGIDHMKYIVQENQKVRISGEINRSSNTRYNNNYDNEEIELVESFLKFEHTDGLNYINLELRRFDRIFTYENIHLNLTEGLGIGFLLPKTNTILLNNERYDQFHLSGYGLNSVLGLNLSYKRYFIQSELKGGLINMPEIRTTKSTTDKASQYFFFSQINILIGVAFRLKKTKNPNQL
jgi:hypothetical protein